MMKIVIGADPLGFDLKNTVKELLEHEGHDVMDVSTNDPIEYQSVGFEVGKRIASKQFDYGFIFCGTGMGVSLVANKFTGVYCALCESIETATLSRKINNANILAMGGLVVTPYMAKKMVQSFLTTDFSYGFDHSDPDTLRCGYEAVQQLEKEIQVINQKN
ncbi:hypothetical protein CBF34_08950 [Vagococcus penaei]|uniref:Uncharacterized protein n=2 Tax=Vagococcus penaei TaxID=633807 RepID=A0A1Q2D519_9ENTE|nr:RpiB/LacA/LacB family sugar-phosphate isomerase [Vagococcus penaei]AQP53381.1 hypothetical protein BW732_03440 [Vagococcus penaei]RST99703.1 hypothetical protein CBF34_08950 [Vagococcus penaei]